MSSKPVVRWSKVVRVCANPCGISANVRSSATSARAPQRRRFERVARIVGASQALACPRVSAPRQRGKATRLAATPTNAPAMNQKKAMRPPEPHDHVLWNALARGSDNTHRARAGPYVSGYRQPVSNCSHKFALRVYYLAYCDRLNHRRRHENKNASFFTMG